MTRGPAVAFSGGSATWPSTTVPSFCTAVTESPDHTACSASASSASAPSAAVPYDITSWAGTRASEKASAASGRKVLGDRLFRGVGGTAGEVGHVQVDPAGVLCRCVSRGSIRRVSPRWSPRDTPAPSGR